MAPDAPTPHDLTVENILYVADHSLDACGCEHRGGRWFLCSYHEGYDDGVVTMLDRAADALEAQAARITELEAALPDHTLTTTTEETTE